MADTSVSVFGVPSDEPDEAYPLFHSDGTPKLGAIDEETGAPTDACPCCETCGAHFSNDGNYYVQWGSLSPLTLYYLVNHEFFEPEGNDYTARVTLALGMAPGGDPPTNHLWKWTRSGTRSLASFRPVSGEGGWESETYYVKQQIEDLNGSWDFEYPDLTAIYGETIANKYREAMGCHESEITMEELAGWKILPRSVSHSTAVSALNGASLGYWSRTEPAEMVAAMSVVGGASNKGVGTFIGAGVLRLPSPFVDYPMVVNVTLGAGNFSGTFHLWDFSANTGGGGHTGSVPTTEFASRLTGGWLSLPCPYFGSAADNTHDDIVLDIDGYFVLNYGDNDPYPGDPNSNDHANLPAAASTFETSLNAATTLVSYTPKAWTATSQSGGGFISGANHKNTWLNIFVGVSPSSTSEDTPRTVTFRGYEHQISWHGDPQQSAFSFVGRSITTASLSITVPESSVGKIYSDGSFVRWFLTDLDFLYSGLNAIAAQTSHASLGSGYPNSTYPVLRTRRTWNSEAEETQITPGLDFTIS